MIATIFSANYAAAATETKKVRCCCKRDGQQFSVSAKTISPQRRKERREKAGIYSF
jgi:hypothetical protein